MGEHLSSSPLPHPSPTPLPLLLSLIPNLIFSPLLFSSSSSSSSSSLLPHLPPHILTILLSPSFFTFPLPALHLLSPLSLPPPPSSSSLLPPPSSSPIPPPSLSLTRPRLGDSLSKVLAAGLVYFLFAFVDGIVRERSVSLCSFCS